jgi:hypothetical protein
MKGQDYSRGDFVRIAAGPACEEDWIWSTLRSVSDDISAHEEALEIPKDRCKQRP